MTENHDIVPSPMTANPIKMVIGIVIFMAIAKIAYRNLVDNSVNPGPERGDIRLASDVLPKTLNDWKIDNFKSPSVEAGVAGIIGWTHSWTVRNNNLTGLVCFDQIGFMGWHELALCYEAIGWTVTNRTVLLATSPQVGDWHSVSLQLTNSQNEHALLLYSIFDGTGTPKSPPEISGYIPGQSLSAEQKRCLQCQIMIPCQSRPTLEQQASAFQLHKETCELFRQEWLRQNKLATGQLPTALRPQ